MQTEREARSRRAGLRTWGLYLLALTAWVTAVIALATPTRNFGLPAAPGIPFDRAGGYGGEPDEPEELDF